MSLGAERTEKSGGVGRAGAPILIRASGRSFFIAAVTLVVTGCSATAGLAAEDPVFAGLDRGTTEEVLASPVAKERVAGDGQAEMRARYQNIVRNFYACRSALSVYQEWVASGAAPEFPHQPVPANPAMWADDEDQDVADFKEAAASGDIERLRNKLTNESGCGAWVPAKTGDLTGPTVGDVVRG